MRNRKAWTSTLIAGSLTVSLLAGCAQGDGKPKDAAAPAPAPSKESGLNKLPLTDNKVTYKWLVKERPDAKFNNNWEAWLKIAERTNVAVQWEPVPATGWEEKRKLLVATNSVPDFANFSIQDSRQYGPEGVFLKLNDLIEKHAPNVRQIFKDYPDAKLMATAPDGGIYILPAIEQRRFEFAWMFRQDLASEYGLKAPTNTDEFYELLKAFKAKHPDSFPLTTRYLFQDRSGIFNKIAQMFTEQHNTVIGFNPSTKKYSFTPEHPQFKESMLFMNKLFNEGLLDPEFAVLKANQWEERMLNGKSFVTYDYHVRADQFTDTAKAANKDTKYDLYAFGDIAAKGKKPYQIAAPIVQGSGTTLAKNIKDPVLAIKYMDYLYSDEGTTYSGIGIEGKSYDMVNGKPKFKEGPTDIRAKHGVFYESQTSFVNIKPRIAMGVSPKQEKFFPAIEPQVVDPLPYINFTEQENETLKQMQTNLQKYAETELTKFVMGRTPITDETLKAFVDQSKKLGSDTLVQITNTAMQRTQNAK